MNRSTTICAVLIACGTPPGEPVENSASVVVSCIVQADNVLRYDCVASSEKATGLIVSVWEGSTPLRTLPSRPSAKEHRFVAYGMPPASEIRLVVETDDGQQVDTTLVTQALPPVLESVVSVQGAADLSYLLTLDPCTLGGAVLMLDSLGRVHWYHVFGDATHSGPGGAVDGLALTNRDSVLVVTGKDRLREVGFDGEVRADLQLGRGDFPQPLHHDLYWGDHHVYALDAAVHDLDNGHVVVDGVTVFDHDLAVTARLDLSDHLAPEASGPAAFSYWNEVFPGATDWSHGNSVVQDGDDLLLSFRHLDAVISVEANPDAEDFGGLNWRLTGSGASPLMSDFTWVDGGQGVGFTGQHHVSMSAEGRLMMFDNAALQAASSGLEVALHPGQAEITRRWPLQRVCAVQGGMVSVGDGALLTCGDARFAALIDAASNETWRLSIDCPTGVVGPLSRVLPVGAF